MREIKFRAWNKYSKTMYYTLDVGVEGNMDLLDFSGIGDSYELMQYTGLKDKNGKEIYEGDLLREPPKNDWEQANYLVQEVFWHDNDRADTHIGWQMNRTHWQGNLSGGSIWNKCLPKYVGKMIVIGNIYQNPELLSSENKWPNKISQQ